MKNIWKQAKELEARLAQTQKELENTVLEVSSGGGAVKITISGQQKVQQVKLSPEAVEADDIELLEDLLVAAINEAIEQSQKLAQSRLAAITGNLKLPGLP